MSAAGFVKGLVAFGATCLGMAFFAGPASAGDTVWLCKPGDPDNPCLGTLGGVSYQPDGSQVELEYSNATRTPIDCFYLYPTQTAQTTPNADFSRDKELKAVAVNQARMFSRICDVYAPVYRQYRIPGGSEGGLNGITDEVRDIAYNTAVDGWNDYLENYNKGRGVVLIGHSQGTSHLARLIAERIDGDAKLRSRVISAILPGANVYVPKGGVSGGQFQNIPACQAGDQIGCVIAYHSMKSEPPANGAFGRMDTGYWVNPSPRPDPDQFEAMCVNPAELSGDAGVLRPLANLSAFVGFPEGAKPWQAMPDFYRAECRSNDRASWLEVSDIRQPGDSRQDITTLIERGPNKDLHTGDINLALNNLIDVTRSQSQAWLARERNGPARERARVRKRLGVDQRQARRLSRRASLAGRRCRAGVRPACRQARQLRAGVRRSNRRVAQAKRRVQALNRRINDLRLPD
jgi:hypothetical protein